MTWLKTSTGSFVSTRRVLEIYPDLKNRLSGDPQPALRVRLDDETHHELAINAEAAAENIAAVRQAEVSTWEALGTVWLRAVEIADAVRDDHDDLAGERIVVEDRL